jgi:outer membrane autotransporter protein
VNAVGPYVPPEDGGGGIGPFAAAAGEIGTATVVNAGTLAGTDYALQVNAGRAVVDNRGLIDGAVRLTANDDVLTNAGRFNLAKDSDFGDGADLFVNTGLLAVRPEATGPGAVTLLGLETFRNQGGLVDLRNGHAGDVLTLAGDYVGSGDATLGLDVGGAAVDKLVIAGAATGSTRIVLHATGAPLTGAQPITLVQAGAGSAADAFTLANPEIGFVRYALSLDPGAAAAAVGAAAPTTFVLMSSAGGSAYRALKLQENARDVWTASADAWSAHMAELRDQSWAGGGASPTRRLWGQAFGSTLSRDQRGAQGDDLGWRRDDYGLQFGAELATREQAGGRLQLGATGGWVNSTVNFSGAADRASFDTFNLGGYAGWLKGPLYVNVLAKADYERLKARSAAAGYDESLNGWSYGARLEAGSRFGSAARFVAPEASLAWTRTDLDALKAAGQTVAFDAETALRAKLGARVGGSRRLADGGQAVFYAGAALVHDFGAASALTLQSGGTSQALHDTRPPTRGQGVVGVNATTARGLSGFVEADADFGGGFSGGGARLGVRLKF